jgi:hypothetical protein
MLPGVASHLLLQLLHFHSIFVSLFTYSPTLVIFLPINFLSIISLDDLGLYLFPFFAFIILHLGHPVGLVFLNILPG